ncbi:MAG: hypothetical protein P9M14_17005 [Candidatus Alcyoniella australis]|nr:hypothetical protein [Candidatus Alcyoniella australis]
MRSRFLVLGLFIGTPIGFLALAVFCTISLSMSEGRAAMHALNFLGLLFAVGGLVFSAFWALELARMGRSHMRLVFTSDELEHELVELAARELLHEEAKQLLDQAKADVAQLRSYRYNTLQSFLISHAAHLLRDRLNLLARIEREAKIRQAKQTEQAKKAKIQAQQEKAEDASPSSVGYRGALIIEDIPGEGELLKEVRAQIESVDALSEAMKMVNAFEQQLETDASLDPDTRAGLVKKIKDEMYGRYYEK